MSDMLLECKDCGSTFTFTEKEQNFYAEQGWNPAIRCYECRQAKKLRNANKGKKEYN